MVNGRLRASLSHGNHDLITEPADCWQPNGRTYCECPGFSDQSRGTSSQVPVDDRIDSATLEKSRHGLHASLSHLPAACSAASAGLHVTGVSNNFPDGETNCRALQPADTDHVARLQAEMTLRPPQLQQFGNCSVGRPLISSPYWRSPHSVSS
jgi:hypothetical protein